MPNDRELRERFAALRRQDQERAGEYATFLRRAPRRATATRSTSTRATGTRAWAASGATVSLVLALFAAWLFMGRSARIASGSRQASITEWKSPTDFLLRTPGEEVLRNVPRIGDWPVFIEIQDGSRKSPAVRNPGS